MRGCLHLQLDGTFWRAGYCYYRQRHTIHLCSVVFYLHEPGHQARAYHCLPPTEQWHGGACAQADQGCPTCTWCGSRVAFPSSVGIARPTCRTQGGFGGIFSGAGYWDTTGPSWTAPARARSSTCRRAAATHEAAVLCGGGQHSAGSLSQGGVRVRAGWRPHMPAHNWWSPRGRRPSPSRWASGRRSCQWIG